MRTLTMLFALILLAGTAVAQDEPIPSKELDTESATIEIEKTPAEIEADATARAAALELRRQLNAELAANVELRNQKIDALVAKLDQAATSDQRHELQRQISDLKRQGHRDLLTIQLKYAELGGHTEQAENLRERVTRFDEGPVVDPNAKAAVRTTRHEGGAR